MTSRLARPVDENRSMKLAQASEDGVCTGSCRRRHLEHHLLASLLYGNGGSSHSVAAPVVAGTHTARGERRGQAGGKGNCLCNQATHGKLAGATIATQVSGFCRSGLTMD